MSRKITKDSKLAELRAQLSEQGIDPSRHGDLLLIYSVAAEQFDAAASRIAESALLTKGPHGTIVANPLIEIQNQAAATMERVGRQLGLSPDHRVSASPHRWADWMAALYD